MLHFNQLRLKRKLLQSSNYPFMSFFLTFPHSVQGTTSRISSLSFNFKKNCVPRVHSRVSSTGEINKKQTYQCNFCTLSSFLLPLLILLPSHSSSVHRSTVSVRFFTLLSALIMTFYLFSCNNIQSLTVWLILIAHDECDMDMKWILIWKWVRTETGSERERERNVKKAEKKMNLFHSFSLFLSLSLVRSILACFLDERWRDHNDNN